jgi:putative intracellular protease/amidase
VSPSSPPAVLIALTSHAELGDTGRSTGAYLPEVARPWREFASAGFVVDLVSVAGGRPPLDGVDLDDSAQQAFVADPEMAAKLDHTLDASQVSPAGYSAIFYAGGHGTMWDFPSDPELARLAQGIYEAGGVVAAVCHGPAALVDLRLSNGRRLIDGKQLSAFTNDEEEAVGLSDVVPFLLQTRLEDGGAKHTGAPNFQPWIVVDERLVTGQNPASASGVARAVVALLTDTP